MSQYTGYTKNTNSDRRRGDIGREWIPLDQAIAVCNANSACIGVTHDHRGNGYAKRATADPMVSDGGYDWYAKNSFGTSTGTTVVDIDGTQWTKYEHTDLTPLGYGYVDSYEFRGSPGGGLPNDSFSALTLSCNSDPSCDSFTIDRVNPRGGWTIHGVGRNNTDIMQSNGRDSYIRVGARPVPKYTTKTIPFGATVAGIVTTDLGNAGGHYCQNDHWPGDSLVWQLDQSADNRHCQEGYPMPSRCPAIFGKPRIAHWVDPANNNNYSQIYQRPAGIQCGYDSIPESALFNNTTMQGFFADSVTSTARTDFCNTRNFSALKADTTECIPHYTSVNRPINNELLKRVVSEGPTWITDQVKRDLVMTCVTSGDSTLALDAANLFFDRINGVNGHSYQGIAVSDMPTDLAGSWGNNTQVVGFMNQLLRTPAEAAGAIVPASIQTIAVATISAYCSAHSDQEACACVNATKSSPSLDPLTRCSTTDVSLPGCDELKTLNDRFAGITSPNLFPFVAAIKRAFIPRCYSSKCTAADTAGSQSVLRPDVYQATACNSNLNVCISSISAGRDIKADVNVQQSCVGATGQALPSDLSSVSDRSGETVTAAGGGSPSTTSGPVRDGTTGDGTRTVNGVTFNESDLIIKHGKSAFIDEYLPTPKKQKGALGGCIAIVFICCCLILLLAVSGGNEGPSGPSIANILAAQSRGSAMTAGS